MLRSDCLQHRHTGRNLLADEARSAVQDQRPRGLFRLGAMESTAAVPATMPIPALVRKRPIAVLRFFIGNVSAMSDMLDGMMGASPAPTPIRATNNIA